MQVSLELSKAFGEDFELLLEKFLSEQGLIPSSEKLTSPRFLSRSVLPHLLKLSEKFNRLDQDQSAELAPYWKQSSNPANLRLTYFLYYMPTYLYRVASIWGELARLGYRWPHSTLKGIEFGAGPASATCGIAAAERFTPVGLPAEASWALIEQDRTMLNLGFHWAQAYFGHVEKPLWEPKAFHRKINPAQGWLPKSAPRFNLWLMSFYLNEIDYNPEEMADLLIRGWDRHLDDDSIIIIVEPALKAHSRKLLELRRALLHPGGKKSAPEWLQILLPCLGHQACGALARPDDWCHEEVTWWRPGYFRRLDQLAHLDKKSLPFSYLVLAKSSRTREEILPELAHSPAESRYRIVSPAHKEGPDLEFYICGADQKRKTRFSPKEFSVERGDILTDTLIRGDVNASRIDHAKKLSRT